MFFVRWAKLIGGAILDVWDWLTSDMEPPSFSRKTPPDETHPTGIPAPRRPKPPTLHAMAELPVTIPWSDDDSTLDLEKEAAEFDSMTGLDPSIVYAGDTAFLPNGMQRLMTPEEQRSVDAVIAAAMAGEVT